MCANRHSDKYEIYCIIGEDFTPVYVGQAKDAYRRFRGHLVCNDVGNAALTCWIQDKKAAGRPPQVRILEIVWGRDAANAAERKWIEHYTHDKFLRLFNRAGNTHRFIKGAPSFCHYIVFPVELSFLNRLVAEARGTGQPLSEILRYAAETFALTLQPQKVQKLSFGQRSKVREKRV